MSKQWKVYGDVVQDYYIIVTADNHDDAWNAAVATPKKDWKKEDLIKTFDYMLLVDTKSMSVGYTTWDKVYECVDDTANEPKSILKKTDYTMIAHKVIPSEKDCDVDRMFSFIEEHI